MTITACDDCSAAGTKQRPDHRHPFAHCHWTHAGKSGKARPAGKAHHHSFCLVTGMLAEDADAHDEARLSAFLTDGHQYEVILLCAVAAIILIGPGRYGLDAGRGWARRPFIGSFAALVLGIGAGVAIWVLLNGTNPLA